MQRSDQTQCERPSDQLAELANRVSRLRPDHRYPHRFHEEKSEIAFELTLLAGKVS